MSGIESCETCRYRLRLEKLDYSGKGCEHTDMDGFVCMCFGHEGVAEWMIGIDQKGNYCECWQEKTTKEGSEK